MSSITLLALVDGEIYFAKLIAKNYFIEYI